MASQSRNALFAERIQFIHNLNTMPFDNAYRYVEAHIFEYARHDYSIIFHPNTPDSKIRELLYLDTIYQKEFVNTIIQTIRMRVPYRWSKDNMTKNSSSKQSVLNISDMPSKYAFKYVESYIFEYAPEDYDSMFHPNISNTQIVELLKKLSIVEKKEVDAIVKAIRSFVPYRPIEVLCY